MTAFGPPAVITAEWVREQVDDIRACAGDPEMAHGNEDHLFSVVLRAIADGAACIDPQECAQEAIKAEAIDFPRWMA